MSDAVALENEAWLGRITCGWKKADLPLDVVRRYWRDVHSPAIARRAGLWEYRHFQFDAVQADALGQVEGVGTDCEPDAQLMWTSDVRYHDQAGLDAFGADPDSVTLKHLLGDIDLIVDRSTTYRAVERNAATFVDRTGEPAPQGPPPQPHYGLFLRRRTDEAVFRSWLGELSARWAEAPGVLRLRLSLLDAPDMEAERRAGYPIKTHPAPQQYQAWIDLVVEDKDALPALVASDPEFARHVGEAHAYPVAARYTSNVAGAPTLVGWRGYPAYDAIKGLGAANQTQAALLGWMFGERAAQPMVGLPA